jgi:hypothetical protein
MIGRRFGWVRTCIIDPPSVSVLVSIVNATTMASSVALLATVILPENSAMYFSQCLAHIWPGASSLNHLVGAGDSWSGSSPRPATDLTPFPAYKHGQHTTLLAIKFPKCVVW